MIIVREGKITKDVISYIPLLQKKIHWMKIIPRTAINEHSVFWMGMWVYKYTLSETDIKNKNVCLFHNIVRVI